jgi:hypothetical protein
MAVLWLDSFDHVSEARFNSEFKSDPLPEGCLLRQSGAFETEVLECPVGYAIVEEGKYQWRQVGNDWVLEEKK